RGFALVRDAGGAPLHAAAAVSPGMRLDIEFSDGHVAAVSDGHPSSDAPAAPKRRPKATVPKQGSLF
ncbi:MAG: exodeoxyribonuclease VII large subunit, partial [Pseudorhodoplanes sp.]|nr:exodeoxyribonuclease VII large subunit [Pseudorhodoplanes sp.]